MQDKIITLKNFDNYYFANIAFSKLQSYGLNCSLIVDDSLNITPLHTNSSGGYKILIFEKDLEAANSILRDIEN